MNEGTLAPQLNVNQQQIQELLKRRNFDQAETLVRQALHKSPTDADYHYLLGVTEYMRGDLPKTIQAMKQALSLDPRHTDAAVCLSVLYNDIGKYDEAKKVFEQANQSVSYEEATTDASINRKFAVKHLELADLYFRYRRYDEAIDEYSKAATLDPANLDLRIRRAKAYAKKGYLSRAIQELQLLKSERPDYAPARIQLGLLHFSQGSLLDAELEWEAVLSNDPAHREALAYLEMAKEHRDREDKSDRIQQSTSQNEG
jgi:tetratricopeptide (TPR) repeat protein